MLITAFGPTGFASWAAHGAEANFKSALDSIRRDQAERHVGVLADDTFEGREAGSRGGRAAAVYIGKDFQRLGFLGAGDSNGYYQSFGANYRNILAKVEGSDPVLKDQYILVGAHYDHVGYGNAQNSYGPTGYIHNGADDNASGAAALLEIAEAFAQVEPKPKRTIIFALWDAEEKGLLGSKHWLSAPTIPLQQLVLAVNMDMVGRVRNDRVEVIGTRTLRGLRRVVSEHNQEPNLILDFTWEMADNSDHHPFNARGIPVFMLHSGLHGDYHRPSDDVERVDHAGIERSAKLIFGTVYDLANQPQLPGFRQESRNEGLSEQKTRELPLPLPQGRFGVRWTDVPGGTGGVVVSGVDAGSPAQRAGFQPGDRITRFAGHDVTDGNALRSLVATAVNPAVATIQRGTQTSDVSIELRGAPVRLGIAWRTDDALPGCVIVTRVTPGSPAAKGDLRINDAIYQIAGQDFVTGDDFREIASRLPLPYEMVVERKGRIDTRTIEPWPIEASTSAAAD